MNTQHTPGPWSVSPTKHRTIIASAQGFHVAAMDDASPADAALIAAAPAMLEALRALTAVVESYEYGRPWPGRPHAQMDAARAAIARATGA